MDLEFLSLLGLGTTVISAILTTIWFYRKRWLERKDIKMVEIEFSPPEGVDKETVRKIIIYFENLEAGKPINLNGEAQVIG